jgi:hypothetical protein
LTHYFLSFTAVVGVNYVHPFYLLRTPAGGEKPGASMA